MLARPEHVLRCRRRGPGLGATRRFIGGIQMPFARHATDHQRPHAHEARPQSAEKLSKHPDTGTGTLKKILVEKEAGLDRSHRSAVVLDDKVTIVEALLDRVLDDLIVAMVFALRPKGLFPTRTTCQLGPRDELHCKGAWILRWHSTSLSFASCCDLKA